MKLKGDIDYQECLDHSYETHFPDSLEMSGSSKGKSCYTRYNSKSKVRSRIDFLINGKAMTGMTSNARPSLDAYYDKQVLPYKSFLVMGRGTIP